MKSKIKLPSSWQTITENSDESCLDFSVNINPLGIPGTVKQQLSNLQTSQEYIQILTANICPHVLRKNIMSMQTQFYAETEPMICCIVWYLH